MGVTGHLSQLQPIAAGGGVIGTHPEDEDQEEEEGHDYDESETDVSDTELMPYQQKVRPTKISSKLDASLTYVFVLFPLCFMLTNENRFIENRSKEGTIIDTLRWINFATDIIIAGC